MSSPVMRSTESLALFAAGTGFCRAGSDAADSLFLVALCTDTLRESPRRPISFAALRLRSARDVEGLRRRACKILMEMPISGDGLDHILDVVNDQTLVGAARDVAKVRTASQIRPASPLGPDVYMIKGLGSQLSPRTQ
jgi:hypothetical protein